MHWSTVGELIAGIQLVFTNADTHSTVQQIMNTSADDCSHLDGLSLAQSVLSVDTECVLCKNSIFTTDILTSKIFYLCFPM